MLEIMYVNQYGIKYRRFCDSVEYQHSDNGLVILCITIATKGTLIWCKEFSIKSL